MDFPLCQPSLNVLPTCADGDFNKTQHYEVILKFGDAHENEKKNIFFFLNQSHENRTAHRLFFFSRFFHQKQNAQFKKAIFFFEAQFVMAFKM